MDGQSLVPLLTGKPNPAASRTCFVNEFAEGGFQTRAPFIGAAGLYDNPDNQWRMYASRHERDVCYTKWDREYSFNDIQARPSSGFDNMLVVALRQLTLALVAQTGLLDIVTLTLVARHILGRARYFPTLAAARRFNAQGWARRRHQAATRALNARIVPLVRRGDVALGDGRFAEALRLFEKAMARAWPRLKDTPSERYLEYYSA